MKSCSLTRAMLTSDTCHNILTGRNLSVVSDFRCLIPGVSKKILDITTNYMKSSSLFPPPCCIRAAESRDRHLQILRWWLGIILSKMPLTLWLLKLRVLAQFPSTQCLFGSMDLYGSCASSEIVTKLPGGCGERYTLKTGRSQGGSMLLLRKKFLFYSSGEKESREIGQ